MAASATGGTWLINGGPAAGVTEVHDHIKAGLRPARGAAGRTAAPVRRLIAALAAGPGRLRVKGGW